jgi:hypothetical protein
MTNRVRILGLIAALVATAALGTTIGIAKAPGTGTPAPGVQAAKPSGYAIVEANFTAPNGQQTNGTVTCPKTKNGVTRDPLGGGVAIDSDSLSAKVNSSYPLGASWGAYVNNNSGVDVTFTVLAICAKPHKHYQVVSNSVANPAGAQNTVTAACPSGTKVTGGGAINNSFDLAVNINTSIPSGNGWRIDANNASTGGNTLTSYAVCSASWGASTGYNVALGTAATNPAGSENQATVACASGQSVLGGGAFSSSGSISVNMNSTYPISGGWVVYENNASSSSASITAYAICAT